MDNLLPVFVVVPLGMAFLIAVFGKSIRNFSNIATLTAFMVTMFCSYVYFFRGDHVSIVYAVGGWTPVEGIPVGIHLLLDPLSGFILVIINTMAFFSALYSVNYITRYTGESYYYTLLSIMVAALNGLVLSADLFNQYVFLEVAVISSFALVAFGTDKEELEASFKYQVLGGIATSLILFGIIILYWHTKTLNIQDIAGILQGQGSNQTVIIFSQVLFIAGFGLKAAIMPFHGWLPDAHSSAPSPISAMLSGVVIKAAGLYVLFRLLFNMFDLSYELSIIITVLGSVSMVFGVFLAVGQWDLKRLLAYHSISQMGYVVTGVGIGMMILASGGNIAVASLAISGGLFHLINHAVFKGLLFMNAGALEFRLGTRDLGKMGGLAEKMPVTYGTSLGASMAISGIPPFNGFFSKLIIIIAAIQAKYYLIAVLAVIVSIITLASFMKVQRYAFLGSPNRITANVKEVPVFMSVSMIVLAILCLALSLLIIPDVRESVLQPAVDILTGGNNYMIDLINR